VSDAVGEETLSGARHIVNIVSDRYYLGVANVNDDANEFAELILQIGRAAYADQAQSGLTQAQWIALRFFGRANRFSRTVSGFADFHATTRGTASQTIKSLVRNGYLTRRPSERDGRSVQFDLTPTAHRKLVDDPLENVVRAATTLGAKQCVATISSLRSVLGEVQQATHRESFGVCRLCGHLRSGEKSGSRCQLMRESLAVGELEEMCTRFQAKP
jgi:DNA-binding MarR family transcriptional regulator